MQHRWQRFAAEYAVCGNGAEAARRAGYSTDRARRSAFDLLRKPAIKAEIERVRKTAENAAIATLTEAKMVLSCIIRAKLSGFIRENGTLDLEAIRASGQELSEYAIADGKLKLRDPVAAIERLAKLCGWDQPEKLEHKISRFTDDELERMLADTA